MTDQAVDLVLYAGKLMRRLRRDVGISAVHRVLALLDDIGPAGISQLAAADGCSQPTMSAQISALVAEGLAAKVPHPSDARSSVVSLTDHGRERLAQSRAHIADSVRERLAPHSPAEIDTAIAVLRSLVEKEDS